MSKSVKCLLLWLALVWFPGPALGCDVYRNLVDFRFVDFVAGQQETIKTGLLIQPKTGSPILLIIPISSLNGHKRLEAYAGERFGDFEWLWAGELRFRRGKDRLELVEANETSGTAAERGLRNSVDVLRGALTDSSIDATHARFTPFKKGQFEHLSGPHRKLQGEFNKMLEELGLEREDNVSHQMGGRMMALNMSFFMMGRYPEDATFSNRARSNLPVVLEYFRFMAKDGFEVPGRRAFDRLGRKILAGKTLSAGEFQELEQTYDGMMKSYHQHNDAVSNGSRVGWISLSATAP